MQQDAIMRSENTAWDLSRLLDEINVGFFSRDVTHNQYFNISQGCEYIYGYTTDDFRADPSLYLELIHPDDRVIADRQSGELERGRKSVAEYRIIHKDGTVRWIELRAIPTIREGRLVQVDGAITDITDRKLTEIELSESRAFFEDMINALPGVFYVFDSQGRYKFWNKAVENLTGYSAHEMTSIHPLDLFADDEKELVMKSIHRVVEKGNGNVEAHLVGKGGASRLPFYFSGRLVMLGNEPHIVGMGVDITEKRKAEDAVQRSEAMLTHVLNSIPQAIFWKDLNSTYLGCNMVFARQAGLNSPREVIGLTDFDLHLRPEDGERYRADDREIMLNDAPKLHIVEHRKRLDGEYMWSDTTKIPLKTKENEVYGILGIYEDITQRVLEEERLQKANEDLIRKNIGLKQFSYIVSHNLRSPISKLLGLTSLLDEDAADPMLNGELISYIKSEVSDLDTVVRDLNTIVAAQDPGNMPLEEISIEEEVKLVVRSLDTDIFNCDASIQVDLKEAPVLKTVRAYFYSVLFNLVSNAIKYRHPERRPEISIKSARQQDLICITVRDNGLGIDMAKYGDKVFGLYNRFHNGSIPGKGIGLNLVKTQVETLGGRIELESAPDGGSCFQIFLPVA